MTQSIEIDGHRVIAACESILNEAAQSTLNKLRSLHAHGRALHPGSIIMFGWAPLKLHDEGGDWVLYELDFTQPTLTWVRGVDTTLQVLNLQAAVVHAVGVAPRETRYDDFVLVEPAAESAPDVFLARVEPHLDHDSGWFAGVEREDGRRSDAERVAVPMAGLVGSCPQWVPYLALPPGYRLAFRDGRLVQLSDPDGRKRQIPRRGTQ
jgi:hypothetical protein